MITLISLIHIIWPKNALRGRSLREFPSCLKKSVFSHRELVSKTFRTHADALRKNFDGILSIAEQLGLVRDQIPQDHSRIEIFFNSEEDQRSPESDLLQH